MYQGKTPEEIEALLIEESPSYKDMAKLIFAYESLLEAQRKHELTHDKSLEALAKLSVICQEQEASIIGLKAAIESIGSNYRLKPIRGRGRPPRNRVITPPMSLTKMFDYIRQLSQKKPEKGIKRKPGPRSKNNLSPHVDEWLGYKVIRGLSQNPSSKQKDILIEALRDIGVIKHDKDNLWPGEEEAVKRFQKSLPRFKRRAEKVLAEWEAEDSQLPK